MDAGGDAVRATILPHDSVTDDDIGLAAADDAFSFLVHWNGAVAIGISRIGSVVQVYGRLIAMTIEEAVNLRGKG
jgi:hypothetical protein